MRRFLRLFLLLALAYIVWARGPEVKTRNVVVTAEEEKVRDAAGYAAIAEIHREIDDDNSGSIDHNETAGFVKDDMKMRSSDSQKRASEFHEEDSAITVDDLWEAWFESPERAWTTEEIKDWLVNVVNLPMYADRVEKIKMDGSVLPRLAAQNSTYMATKLGIKSSVHRQLLRLKALDIVLFGYRPISNKAKDIALGLLLLLLTTLLIVYVRQKKRAIQHVNELNNRLNMLKNMETEFEDVQRKWKEERNNSEAIEGVSAAEVESLRLQLEEAERRLEQNGACSGPPLALQPLLRKTCESEMLFLDTKRQECLKEMKEAIELVDRLQKKQGSVFSSLKLATGAASASDQVDSKIYALRTRMEKIHGLTKDTQDRWMQIESLCGFPILYGSELSHSTSNHHFYSNRSDSSSVSSKSASNGHGNGNHHQITPQPMQQFAAARPLASLPNGVTPDSSAKGQQTTQPIRMVPVQHDVSSPLFADDTDSITSTEKKRTKNNNILRKLFKKSTSKGSLGSTTSTS